MSSFVVLKVKNSTSNFIEIVGYEITCTKRNLPYRNRVAPGQIVTVDFTRMPGLCNVGQNANISIQVQGHHHNTPSGIAIVKPNGYIFPSYQNSGFSLKVDSGMVGGFAHLGIEVTGSGQPSYPCSSACHPSCCAAKDPDCKFVPSSEGCGCVTPSGVVKACYPQGGGGWIPVIQAVDPQTQWAAALFEELEFA